MIRTILTFLASSHLLFSQAPGVSIIEQSSKAVSREQAAIIAQAKSLMEDGAVLNEKTIKEAMKKPTRLPFTPKKPATHELTPKEIADRAHEAHYQVGWAYLCTNCEDWHISLAGGYAVSNDGMIATCAHVVNPKGKDLKKGCLIAVDSKGITYPVLKIHAYHDRMDAALLKIDAQTRGLAFNDQMSPGDRAYCLSRPLKQNQYFSAGIVNRFFWKSIDRGNDDSKVKALAHLRMNVSTRWAPGSSGSAVLDQYGNVIGHVSTIQTLGKKKEDRTLITMHTSVPARAVQTLAEQSTAAD